MKKFKYRWKIGDQEMTGEFQCLDRVVLKAHIERVGGELLEVFEEKEIEKGPEPDSKESLAVKINPVPAPDVSQPLLKKGLSLWPRLNEPPGWLNVIWGWGAVITGAMCLVISIIMLMGLCFPGLGLMKAMAHLQPFWSKGIFIAGFVLFSAAYIAVGLIGLNYPLFTSNVFFIFSSSALAANSINLLRGHPHKIFSILLDGFILWLLLRKKKENEENS